MDSQLVERIARETVDASIRIHRKLGNGLIESAYETCLEHELRTRGFGVERQKWINVIYEGIDLGPAYKIDLLVEGLVVLQLKVVDKLIDVHEAQLMSYLRLGDFPLGFLLNFRAALMKEGIDRKANDYYGNPL